MELLHARLKGGSQGRLFSDLLLQGYFPHLNLMQPLPRRAQAHKVTHHKYQARQRTAQQGLAR
ncbi:hypothetical protein cym2001_05910 [Pseudomonas sp. CYM-20-01]|nr:hypothetical protein cym2001_05910 [Pseudomonas sp. CYM-20-01]